jgi:RimJ/RimL family protein N-acetyltransferase
VAARVVTNRQEIERFLRQDAALHVYGLGDLDPFFFPHVEWQGWYERGELKALFLLYRGTDLPVLMALEEKNPDAAKELYDFLKPSLPERYYAHLSPYLLGKPGTHLKMRLREDAKLKVPCPKGYEIELLTPADVAMTAAFYAAANPQNWFDPRMLATGHYLGVKQDGRLVAVAGVHVYSEEQKVAAVGNIATMPSHRNKRLATAVTAELSRTLRKSVDLIGLNVKADNMPAIKCYERLGFEPVARFHELLVG